MPMLENVSAAALAHISKFQSGSANELQPFMSDEEILSSNVEEEDAHHISDTF